MPRIARKMFSLRARGPHDPAMHLPRDCKMQFLRRHGSCYAPPVAVGKLLRLCSISRCHHQLPTHLYLRLIRPRINSQSLTTEILIFRKMDLLHPGLYLHQHLLQFLLTTTVPVLFTHCLLYTSPSPRDRQKSRMPSSA